MIGTVLSDRYEITGELGRGGMGVVYKGIDPLLRREVAIKMLSPALLDAKSEKRIENEAKVVARLDHPAIVPIHDLGRHDGSLYLVMPLIQGKTLRHKIADGELRLGDVLEIGVQAAQALGYSHSQGVIHRDVKPSNMIVSHQGGGLRLRLLDFGIARDSGERVSRSSNVPGTLTYLSPEQVDEPTSRVDSRTDLYSLGAVLYECLAGEPPFSGTIFSTLYSIVHEPPVGLLERGVEIDEELEGIVLSCLAKDPEERPESCAALARSLARYRDQMAESMWAKPMMRAQEPSAVPSAPAAPRQRETPMIGRDDELGELESRLSAALAGQCQLVLVGGEAGTGKSRLLHELEVQARGRQVQVLRGRFSDWETAFPYQGLCELIQDFFRGFDSTTALSPQNVPDIDDLAPDLVSLYPALSEIPELRRALEAQNADPMALSERRLTDSSQVFELLARTLSRLVEGRPVVLQLENLHAAEVGLEALQYLVRRLGSTPTLVVGSYRSSEVFRGHPLEKVLQSFSGDPRFTKLELQPLDQAGVRSMIEHLVGGAELAPELVERIYGATEGNPFFCQELVKSLLETGAMSPDAGSVWSLSDDHMLGPDSLPATLQQAEERRLERLGEEPRWVLSVASVLGKTFEFEDLEALCDVDDAEAVVEELVAQGLLKEDRRTRGDRLTFTSGIVRDLLYQDLSRRRRRSLHRRHAQSLEKRYSGRLERVLPRLVDHYRAADMAAETVAYGLELCRRSLEAFSPEDAIRAARIALEFVEDEDVGNGRLIEGELAFLLAQAYRALGRNRRALRQAERAAVVFEDLDGAQEEVAAAALLAAEIAWQGRRMDEVRKWVDHGISAARIDESSETLKRLLSLGATVANLRGERAEAAYLDEIRRLELNDVTEEFLPMRGGRLRVALVHPVLNLEPCRVRTAEEIEVAGNIYESLLTTDDEGLVTGCLCDRYESEDEDRRFVLWVRRRLKLSDGTPVGAAELKAALERSVRMAAGLPAPAFAALEGVEAFLAGESSHIQGIAALEPESPGGPERLRFELRESLPIFPLLLTDIRAAVALPGEEGRVLGTGPFRCSEQGWRGLVLERNAKWRGFPALVDAVELRIFDDPAEPADALAAGQVDMVRDLPPDALEELTRHLIYRTGLVETTRKNVYFALFNRSGEIVSQEVVRRVLCEVVPIHDLVWRTLGRFAVPALGMIPPDVVGYDRTQPTEPKRLSKDEALELLRGAGLTLPVHLRAAVHPVFTQRFGRLWRELQAEWASVGLKVEATGSTMEAYLDGWGDADAASKVDLLVGRWNPSYNDPDQFSYALLNSRTGLFRHFYSSPEADLLMERGRREGTPGVRQSLYQRFEDLLEEERVVLPLFHDVDYRLLTPGWGGFRLAQMPPYVSYASIGRIVEEEKEPELEPRRSGEIVAPTPFLSDSLDPALGSFIDHHEMVINVFEPLMRVDTQARVKPWLAESIDPLLGGRAYRIRLRRDLRFHDGRRVTTEDVAYTYERLLRDDTGLQFLLQPIRGAHALAQGKADSLAGCKILSPVEMLLELQRPLAFFPALLSHPATAVVPAGSESFSGRWDEGCCGTGPFRVIGFEPEKRLVLERHPHYWRPGYPKVDRLVFEHQQTPDQTAAAFESGGLTLAARLNPEKVAELRRSSSFQGRFEESPSLSTYFLALGARRGPLMDPVARQTLVECLDLNRAFGTLGRLVSQANGLVPPGLLGHEAPRGRRAPGESDHDLLRGLKLRMAIHPVFRGRFRQFLEHLEESMRGLGVELEIQDCSMRELGRVGRTGEADLLLARWIAVYPDADCFMSGLFDSQGGLVQGLCGSREILGWIEKGRQEVDPALRHGIYRNIEELMAREHLILPLFHEQTYRFAQPAVQGLRLGITIPEVRYDELELGETP